MKTIYVYKTELLGDNGDKFGDESLVCQIECDDEKECEQKFNDEYGSTDYSYSYTRHAN